jgi:hypothetical protein
MLRRRSAVLVAVLALAVVLGPLPALATRPAVLLPVLLIVNSKSDAIYPVDGGCSLSAAIIASNGAVGGYCGTGTPSMDTIEFDIGTGVPVINISTGLPPITDGVLIDGHSGGAKRIELHGPGSGTGLVLDNGTGTVINRLKIDGFQIGVSNGASDTTIKGSIIGPNSSYGIYSHASSATIGGTNGITVGGPCTGDCNLIRGNGSMGLYLSSGGAIVGNFIGTDKTGTSAKPNQHGIVVSSGTWTIGGTTAKLANVISGNTARGIDLHGCVCLIQGNLIGTDVTGKHALANGTAGIASDNDYSSTIGGSVSGAGNVISGNGGSGLEMSQSSGTTIAGNWIGVTKTGASLGNGADGINLKVGGNGNHDLMIGSPTNTAGGNTIAHNAGVGVRITGSGTNGDNYSNSIRRNSIYANGGLGIALQSFANRGIVPPTINSVAPLAGVACGGCVVDIYSDSADEGRVYEGTVSVDGLGNWSYPNTVKGPNVTATSTNSVRDTSQFSAPVAVPAQPDGRIKKGSGAYVGNNIYNSTGANQTKTGKAARGSTIKFGISIQNDGTTAARFSVVATGAATTMYSVRYFKGTKEITTAVVAGTFQTPLLGPGAKVLITAKVKVKSSATKGSNVTRLVTITSQVSSSTRDAVKFSGARS